MERTLSLVLDNQTNRTSLTLLKGQHYEIDAFTSQFEDSEAIRAHFQKKIDAYLEENKNMIETISKNSQRKFRGSIAILEAREKDYSLEIVSVGCLYKKHIAVLKSLLYDEQTMSEMISFTDNQPFSLMPEYIKRVIRCYKIKTAHDKQEINRWLKSNPEMYYEKIRLIHRAYQSLLTKGKKEKSLNTLYKEYLQQQKKIEDEKKAKALARRKKSMQAPIQNETDEFYLIDGIRYRIEDIPFDIDDLKHMDSEYKPDGMHK